MMKKNPAYRKILRKESKKQFEDLKRAFEQKWSRDNGNDENNQNGSE